MDQTLSVNQSILKAQKLKSLPNVDDPRFAHIEARAQLFK
jgi:hypothetical protein